MKTNNEMNSEQQELLDKVYENYWKQVISNNLHLLPAIDLPFTKGEFINKIKTDDEFSKEWGLKIEETKLSQSQRFNWYGNKIGSFMHHDHIEQEMDEYGVPTKLITVTYTDKTIESYE